MLSDDLKEKAVEVISRILSESAFIFVDPLEEDELPDVMEWEVEGVFLGFSGYCTGKLSMWASKDFLRYAAANMLGIDEESEEASEKGLDALKEILNIIVGNLLTTVYGAEPVFDLGIPEKLPPEIIKDGFNKENAIWLQAEGNPVLFLVDIE